MSKIKEKTFGSKDYQIGYLIGERISDELPTLSTDMIRTFNVVEVPENLHKLWLEKRNFYMSKLFGKDKKESSKIFKENLKWYKTNIERVFLDKKIKFSVPNFYQEKFTNVMIKGFEDAVWDCDLSHYKYDSHTIKNNILNLKMKYNYE